jgi:hypothetical protein
LPAKVQKRGRGARGGGDGLSEWAG